MLGRSHGLAGAAAGLTVGLAAPSVVIGLGCGVVGYLAAYVPDLDHPRARAVRVLGPAGWLVCRMLRGLSTALGLPAHRGLSHTVVCALGVGALCGATATLWLGVVAAVAVGVAAVAGVVAALLGDWLTVQSLPLLWWPLSRAGWCPPRGMRIRTGGVAEKWVVVPTLVALVAALLVATVGVA